MTSEPTTNSPAQPQNKRHRWTADETQSLLDFIIANQDLYAQGASVWAPQCQQDTLPHMTTIQIVNRWSYVQSLYNTAKSMIEKAGEGTNAWNKAMKKCPWFDALESLKSRPHTQASSVTDGVDIPATREPATDESTNAEEWQREEEQREEGQREEEQRKEEQREEEQRKEEQREEEQREEEQREEEQREEEQGVEEQREEEQKEEEQRKAKQRQDGQRDEGQREEGPNDEGDGDEEKEEQDRIVLQSHPIIPAPSSYTSPARSQINLPHPISSSSPTPSPTPPAVTRDQYNENSHNVRKRKQTEDERFEEFGQGLTDPRSLQILSTERLTMQRFQRDERLAKIQYETAKEEREFRRQQAEDERQWRREENERQRQTQLHHDAMLERLMTAALSKKD